MVLGKLPVPGRSTHTFDCGRARAYYACSRSGGGYFDIVSLIYYFLDIVSLSITCISFSLSLGDGPI